MSARFVALWPPPERDVEGFDEHYRTVHQPTAEAWPGVRSTMATRATSNPFGGEPAYHVVFVAEFDSDADLQAAMGSAEMRRTADDMRTIRERWGIRPTVLTGHDL